MKKKEVKENTSTNQRNKAKKANPIIQNSNKNTIPISESKRSKFPPDDLKMTNSIERRIRVEMNRTACVNIQNKKLEEQNKRLRTKLKNVQLLMKRESRKVEILSENLKQISNSEMIRLELLKCIEKVIDINSINDGFNENLEQKFSETLDLKKKDNILEVIRDNLMGYIILYTNQTDAKEFYLDHVLDLILLLKKYHSVQTFSSNVSEVLISTKIDNEDFEEKLTEINLLHKDSLYAIENLRNELELGILERDEKKQDGARILKRYKKLPKPEMKNKTVGNGNVDKHIVMSSHVRIGITHITDEGKSSPNKLSESKCEEPPWKYDEELIEDDEQIFKRNNLPQNNNVTLPSDRLNLSDEKLIAKGKYVLIDTDNIITQKKGITKDNKVILKLYNNKIVSKSNVQLFKHDNDNKMLKDNNLSMEKEIISTDKKKLGDVEMKLKNNRILSNNIRNTTTEYKIPIKCNKRALRLVHDEILSKKIEILLTKKEIAAANIRLPLLCDTSREIPIKHKRNTLDDLNNEEIVTGFGKSLICNKMMSLLKSEVKDKIILKYIRTRSIRNKMLFIENKIISTDIAIPSFNGIISTLENELTRKYSETLDRGLTNNNLSINKEVRLRDDKIPLTNSKRKLTLKHDKIMWKFNEIPSINNVTNNNEISTIYNRVESVQNKISLKKCGKMSEPRDETMIKFNEVSYVEHERLLIINEQQNVKKHNKMLIENEALTRDKHMLENNEKAPKQTHYCVDVVKNIAEHKQHSHVKDAKCLEKRIKLSKVIKDEEHNFKSTFPGRTDEKRRLNHQTVQTESSDHNLRGLSVSQLKNFEFEDEKSMLRVNCENPSTRNSKLTQVSLGNDEKFNDKILGNKHVNDNCSSTIKEGVECENAQQLFRNNEIESTSNIAELGESMKLIRLKDVHNSRNAILQQVTQNLCKCKVNLYNIEKKLNDEVVKVNGTIAHLRILKEIQSHAHRDMDSYSSYSYT